MPAMIGLGAVSLISGFSGSKSAKKDRRAALALQQQSLDFSKQRYTDYKALYGNLEKQLVGEAEKGVTADIKGVTHRAVGDVTTAFRNADEANIQRQQRYGINPNSGRAESAARDTATNKALATASLVNTQRETERRRAAEETYNRRRDVTGLGVNQMNSAASGVTSGLNGMADSYRNSAADKSAQAGKAFSSAGMLIGTGIGRGMDGGWGLGGAGEVGAAEDVSGSPAPVSEYGLDYGNVSARRRQDEMVAAA